MAGLNFDNGLKKYTVNGRGEIAFNPSDDELAKRLFDAVDALQKKSDEYASAIKEAADSPAIFEVTQKMNAEIRELIDGIFGQPVCDAVFGNMSPNAFSGGEPLWFKFLNVVMSELEGAYTEERKKAQAKIAKYTKKYDGKYHR